MAQSVLTTIFSQGMWPQQDARDPLGVWGGRQILTADVTAGPLKVEFQPGADRAGAFLYTCYSAQIAGLTANEAAVGKCRLLTNWPDVGAPIGVQGYGSLQIVNINGASTFTAPFSGPFELAFVQAQDRYILLFDPRPVAGAFTIVELELDRAVDTRLYSFECWGYYWDRQVMQTPGGPRHPGSQ